MALAYRQPSFSDDVDDDVDNTGKEGEPEPRAALRMLRVWHLAEDIARRPGRGRKEMALQAALSERQLQSDLNMIRFQFGLPLVRRSGYRFEHSDEANELTQTHVILLALVVTRAVREPTMLGISLDRRASLMSALPDLVPAYLKSVLRTSLELLTGRHMSNASRLLEAFINRSYVRLHYRVPPISLETVVRPEVLLPFNGKWYVLGTTKRSKLTIFPLEGVQSVSFAG